MGLIGTDITQGFLILYGLIGVVILIIIAILVIDYFNKNKKESWFDTKKLDKTINDLEQESEEKVVNTTVIKDDVLEEVVPVSSLEVTEKINEELYVESDLEKTQAQIEIEEITKALKKAQEEEERIDPYAKFEEEQEQNAIISYKELQEKFDELYDENEKIQYIEDDNLPIDLNELYQKNEEILNPKKVKMDDMNTINISTNEESKFKSSPVISPVYGIQTETEKYQNNTTIKDIEDDIKKTNDFLKILKDLQKNSN